MFGAGAIDRRKFSRYSVVSRMGDFMRLLAMAIIPVGLIGCQTVHPNDGRNSGSSVEPWQTQAFPEKIDRTEQREQSQAQRAEEPTNLSIAEAATVFAVKVVLIPFYFSIELMHWLSGVRC